MTTARSIVTRALRHLGVTAAGEVPTADEAQDALDTLNDMLEGWSNEHLTIVSITTTQFALQAGKLAYTLGQQAPVDVNMVWPSEIEQAQVRVLDNPQQLDLPITVINEQEYAHIRLKTTPSTYPQAVWLHTTFPNATANFWPQPTQINDIILWTRGSVGNFATLDTDIALPRGYRRAIQYNLELELADEHGRQVTQNTFRLANETKMWLKVINTKPVLSNADVPGGTRQKDLSYNWLTDGRGRY